MKKMLICVMLVITIFSVTAYADDINIIVNDTVLNPDTMPVNIDDRVLVPMRAIFESLGVRVEWDEATYSVTAINDTKALRLSIGNKTVEYGIINSDNAPVFTLKRDIDVAPMIINDRTYVPVRAVSEGVGADVSWHDGTKTVVVNSRQNGYNNVFYSSVSDYNKVYKVDTNGVSRVKLSDISAKDVYYDDGYVYFISADDMLYRVDVNGNNQIQLTDYKTEVIKIENEVVYCLEANEKHKGNLHIINGFDDDLGYVMYPVINNGYIYYNVPKSASMRALNIETGKASDVTMYDNQTLYTYNCMFYGDMILVEDGEYFNNIYAFDSDGANKRALNNSVSRICKNQQYDDNIIYINGDNGQNIYYVKTDKSVNEEVVHMPSDTIFVDVLAQNGDEIYYKNMYRKEIYRANIKTKNSRYIGYGDTLNLFDDKLFIIYDGLYVSNLDGQHQRQIYDKVSEFFAHEGFVYAKDSSYKNIIKSDYSGNCIYLTNDIAYSWDTDIIH
ncbi:MAG: DUF5050 domain-containing protein [Clostridia bacterium]|nr:DUF5050 domain-containing protein [Clostridia bacterium]